MERGALGLGRRDRQTDLGRVTELLLVSHSLKVVRGSGIPYLNTASYAFFSFNDIFSPSSSCPSCLQNAYFRSPFLACPAESIPSNFAVLAALPCHRSSHIILY